MGVSGSTRRTSVGGGISLLFSGEEPTGMPSADPLGDESEVSPEGLPARAVMAETGNAGGTTVGEGSEGTGGGSDSSLLLGKTIRATSVIFALRRKMEPKGIKGGWAGVAGGMIFGMVAVDAGFRMKGES